MFQRLATISLIAFASAGCLVNVSHVSNPDPHFERAMKSARAVAGRKGPARELHVLVYSAEDRKLVRVDLPLGLVGKLARNVDFDWDFNDFDICSSSRHGCSEARHRLRSFSGQDLAKLPLGPLVEVTDEDGERVFVYLR